MIRFFKSLVNLGINLRGCCQPLSLLLLFSVISCSHYRMGYKPTPSKVGKTSCTLLFVEKLNGNLKISNRRGFSVKVEIKDFCGLGLSLSSRVEPFDERTYSFSFKKRCMLRVLASSGNCTQVVDIVLEGGK